MQRSGFCAPEHRGKTCRTNMVRTKLPIDVSKTGVRSGVMEKLLLALAQHLQDAGGLDLKECFVNGTFAPAKKGGAALGRPAWQGTKIMGIADSHGIPIALRPESASPAEVKPVEATLQGRIVPDVPERLIGDKAHDSDGLDKRLMKCVHAISVFHLASHHNPL